MKNNVSLALIVKNEVKKIERLIEDAHEYVEEIVITVTHKGSYSKFIALNAKLRKKGITNVRFDFFEWVHDFAAARNHNMAQVKTKFLFWLDADDSFDFSTIPKLVQYAEENDFEAIYLPYNYARDEHGRVVAVHSRERLVRTDIGFEWRGALHETLIIDRQFTAKKLDTPIIEHDSPDIAASIERNHDILLKKATEQPVDPRYLHYLGLSYFTRHDYENAIRVLQEYIKVGGWDEEIYRSLIKMSEASGMLNQTEDAINYALQAAGVMPDYPQAYFCLAQIEFAEGNWKQCLEWLKVAFSKPQPKTMSVVDPTMVERGKVMGASSEFQLQNYRQAEEILRGADDPAVPELMPIFKLEASKERFIEILPAIVKHFDEKKLYNALQEDLKYDQRTQWFRYSVTKPTKWPEKSVVWFCGAGFEEWGPHTTENGMGGSEEAVVYLSREMAKLGYSVTIYGAVNEILVDTVTDFEDKKTHVKINQSMVTYLPWRMFDTRDEFDTLIVWRAPHGIDKLNARVKILDVHDKLEAKDLPFHEDVSYHFKSRYHRELYPHIPDKNAVVIGNGINTGDFNV